MNLGRILAITRRVFRNFKHDRRAVGMMLVAPIMAMTVFGIAFGGNVTDVEVVVVNEDVGHPLVAEKISDKFIENIDEDILIIDRMDSVLEAVKKVEDGEKWAVIHFPPNFTAALLPSGNGTTISIKADQSNSQVYAAILTAMRDASEKTLREGGGQMPLEIDTSDAIYGEGAKFSDFLIPGVLAFAIFLLTTLLTLLTFTTERVNKTLDRLLVTPVTELEIVLGYAIAFGVTGTIQAVILVIYGIAVFDIFVEGSILLAIFLTSLLAIASMALGILLSSATRTEAQAVQMIPLIVLPVFLLSGIFWPFEAIPVYLQPFSYALPPTYAVDGLRSIMIRGWGLAEVWPHILVLLVFVALFLVLATISLRRRG